MVTDLKVFDAFAHFDHHAGTFVTQDGRESALGVIARQREGIGMAHARGLDLNHDLTGGGSAHVYLGDFQGLACLKCNGCATFHVADSLSLVAASMPQSVRGATPNQGLVKRAGAVSRIRLGGSTVYSDGRLQRL